MNKPVTSTDASARPPRTQLDGGELVGAVLAAHGVKALFTLCGGHISPILLGTKRRDIPVVDVRHEANAVFAADALARLTGIPGVAAVTAGPGTTNTITAVKNAQLAQSPVIILGGAAATMLKGRGALQDIDQLALYEPHVKWAVAVDRVRDLVPTLTRAFEVASGGVPGPVFVEIPVDLLYHEPLVREWYLEQGGSSGKSLGARLRNWYLERHVNRLFAGRYSTDVPAPRAPDVPEPDPAAIRRAAAHLGRAKRPVLVIGSQATLVTSGIDRLVAAVERLGIPVYLSGMARGLLGAEHALQMRHKRSKALREADFVLLAGVPCDFRLNYGLHIPKKAVYVSANRSPTDLRKNRAPTVAALGDPAAFVRGLAHEANAQRDQWSSWIETLRERDGAREREIAEQAQQPTEYLNPLRLCQAIDEVLDDDSMLIADGGDFVATASYILAPRRPLSWLDPGVFGTLGVGGGFALGAKLARPSAETWILYGDGSAAYSLAEFDTFARHGLPVIAVVGNDACWSQIAREQVEILGDDVGTSLARTAYDKVAEGYGGKGFLLERFEDVPEVLSEAKNTARSGTPVLINAQIGSTDFRKGSISM